ncbi:hypothetical protein AB3331_10200, partial [Streptococcus sp. H49]
KLAKNLPSKTSNTQKPHSDSFILIVFKTEITVWFYFETSFCPDSFCILRLCFELEMWKSPPRQKSFLERENSIVSTSFCL